MKHAIQKKKTLRNTNKQKETYNAQFNVWLNLRRI